MALSTMRGRRPFVATLKKQKHKDKNKKKRQKRGFPIKDFGNDGGGGFPECLYYPLFVTPEWFYEGSKLFKGKKLGFPPPRHPGNF